MVGGLLRRTPWSGHFFAPREFLDLAVVIGVTQSIRSFEISTSCSFSSLIAAMNQQLLVAAERGNVKEMEALLASHPGLSLTSFSFLFLELLFLFSCCLLSLLLSFSLKIRDFSFNLVIFLMVSFFPISRR